MAARLWHKAPFLRLLTALAAGIVLQWYWQLAFFVLLVCFAGSLLFVLLYAWLAVKQRFALRIFGGSSLLLLLASLGGLLVWCNDVRNHTAWFGRTYHTGNPVLVTIEEPLVEKAASYKALATVYAVAADNCVQKTSGSIILYFKKDAVSPALHYGSQLVFTQPLQPIKNSGNPGGFDYQTYSLFHGLTHQVYLTGNDFVLLPTTAKTGFKTFLFNTRAWVIDNLQRFIRGQGEQGFAEALLIGYRDDLDKATVQAYANTGVVHIIAISGLHLGIIYGLLLFLTQPLSRRQKFSWLRLTIIVVSLWLFSLLAGAGPSVLRSALMFSLFAVGQTAMRRTNPINTLAFSAFVLLCVNPFWLWDVGFQLSYAAVLGILLFYRFVYNWMPSDNKVVRFFWQLMAVCFAAQVFTLPISIYYFHQMPLLFLFTNVIAVPLSGIILMGEIFLCALSFLPAAANLAGMILTHLISFLNDYIEGLSRLPFATWGFLSITVWQTLLLLLFSLAVCYWLMEKQRPLAWVAFSSLAVFMLLRGVSLLQANRQRQLIVYNIPKHPAIDVINGRSYFFLGDSALLHDGPERSFHLQPSRVLHRVAPVQNNPSLKSFTLAGKRILLLDSPLPVTAAEPRPRIDVLVLSKNPRLYIDNLLKAFDIRQVVIDGSVPQWKAALWKKDCDSLHIPCYNVSEQGAFILNW